MHFGNFEKIDAAIAAVVNVYGDQTDDHDKSVTANVDALNKVIKDTNRIDKLDGFDELCRGNTNYTFWITYMNMVSLLLDFIRADREGNWPLHLELFAAMLQWLTSYDYLNYARWGPIESPWKSQPHLFIVNS